VNEAVVASLVGLLDRVRDRSRSTWPALVDAHPDDEARGHAAFASLEASAPELELRAEADDEALIESSPRIKLAARAESLAPPPAKSPEAAQSPKAADAPPLVMETAEPEGDREDAPLLEVVAERALGDVADDEVADAMPLLEHLALGELLEASLALRPRADAW
jgi:hypothetical protein